MVRERVAPGLEQYEHPKVCVNVSCVTCAYGIGQASTWTAIYSLLETLLQRASASHVLSGECGNIVVKLCIATVDQSSMICHVNRCGRRDWRRRRRRMPLIPRRWLRLSCGRRRGGRWWCTTTCSACWRPPVVNVLPAAAAAADTVCLSARPWRVSSCSCRRQRV